MSERAQNQLRQSSPAYTPVSSGLLQRKCACGNHTIAGSECEECREKDEARLQRAAFNPERVQRVPPIIHEVLQSPGQPLDPETRAFFEPRFGHDFSRVRVHTDSKATESAGAVNALAYTVGPDIVFANGGYAPGTPMGRGLLAHELAHAAQQGFSRLRGALEIDPSATAEIEANDFASRIADATAAPHVFGRPDRIPSSLSRALQRAKDRCSGSGAMCAASDRCAIPDPGKEGQQEQSNRWELEVKIDIERSNWESALRNQEFGHTYVRFWETNGREYTYGFYPASELPNESRRTVAGCVHHPDTTHDACIDDIASYSLTQDQYNAGLARAQATCRNGHEYGVTYTCTTYAEEVVRTASKTLPSSRSQPTSVFYQQVPAIDNPNTLLVNVRSARGSLNTDEGIRNWVSANDLNTIGQLPTQEMIRMINRLMDGWVSDEDVDAIDRICQSVTNTVQMARIRAAINPRILDLTDIGQRTRVRIALARNP
jgi:hypothetical protein